MGLITWFLGKLFYPLLFTGGATFFAFRLAQELPLAARKAGHTLGMSYNYFKVTIRVRASQKLTARVIIVFHAGVEAGERDYFAVPEGVPAGARVHPGIQALGAEGKEAVLEDRAGARHRPPEGQHQVHRRVLILRRGAGRGGIRGRGRGAEGSGRVRDSAGGGEREEGDDREEAC
jgi:hypothetical protein